MERFPAEIGVANTPLTLSRVQTAHAAYYYNLITEDGNIPRFLPWARDVTNLKKAKELMNRFIIAWKAGTQYRYTCLGLAQFIGYGGIIPYRDTDTVELAYGVATAYRGQGIAGAIVTSLESTSRNAGVRIAQLDINPANHASRRVAEKLGYISVGINQ